MVAIRSQTNTHGGKGGNRGIINHGSSLPSDMEEKQRTRSYEQAREYHDHLEVLDIGISKSDGEGKVYAF